MNLPPQSCRGGIPILGMANQFCFEGKPGQRGPEFVRNVLQQLPFSDKERADSIGHGVERSCQSADLIVALQIGPGLEIPVPEAVHDLGQPLKWKRHLLRNNPANDHDAGAYQNVKGPVDGDLLVQTGHNPHIFSVIGRSG